MDPIQIARRMKSPVAPFVRRNWHRPPFAKGADVAQRYLRIWNNSDNTLGTNGEAVVLRRLGPLGLRTLVDVGCHRGAWTDVALDAHPQATIHAFEADPYLADFLATRYANEPRVILNAVGLAERDGVATLFVDEDERTVSSLLEGGERSHGVEVPIRRGDAYAAGAGIDHIDYLKIDAEGYDWQILHGFGDLLGPDVRALQFEYNVWNARARRLLADFYDLLEPKGYRLGKVKVNGVDFRDYTISEENWVGPVIVAVHESAPEMIDALRAPHVRRR